MPRNRNNRNRSRKKPQRLKLEFDHHRDAENLINFLEDQVSTTKFRKSKHMLKSRDDAKNPTVIYLSFTENPKIDQKTERELISFLSKKIKLYLIRNKFNPNAVELRKGENQQILVPSEVLDQLQVKLKHKSDYTEAQWRYLTAYKNDDARLQMLRIIFKAIIFTSELNQQLPKSPNGQSAKSLTASLLQLSEFNGLLFFDQAPIYIFTMSCLTETLIARISELIQTDYQSDLIAYGVNFETIIKNIKEKSDSPISTCSNLMLLITLLADYLEAAEDLKNKFIELQQHLSLS